MLEVLLRKHFGELNLLFENTFACVTRAIYDV